MDLMWKKLYVFASWDSNIEAKGGKQPHMMPTLISTILEHVLAIERNEAGLINDILLTM